MHPFRCASADVQKVLERRGMNRTVRQYARSFQLNRYAAERLGRSDSIQYQRQPVAASPHRARAIPGEGFSCMLLPTVSCVACKVSNLPQAQGSVGRVGKCSRLFFTRRRKSAFAWTDLPLVLASHKVMAQSDPVYTNGADVRSYLARFRNPRLSHWNDDPAELRRLSAGPDTLWECGYHMYRSDVQS